MKKGFVLMETIVVIVVISVALLTIFSSYNKILIKLKSDNKYDTTEYVYMTGYIKDHLADKGVEVNDIYPCEYTQMGELNCTNLEMENYVGELDGYEDIFNVKNIYILTDLNNFNKDVNGDKNSLCFDSYMIDYIRKLDVENTDELIIVEYKRPAVDYLYNQKNIVSDYLIDRDKKLEETYIASLEW